MSLMDDRNRVRVPFLQPSPLGRYRPETERRQEIRDGLALIADGGIGPDFNLALVTAEAPEERLFSLAGAFFGAGGYAIVVESDAAPSLEARLLERGWELDEEEPAMLLHPIPERPQPPRDLDIQLVTMQRQFDEFMTLLPEVRRWAPSRDAALDPDVALFVGYAGGRPVATGRLTRFAEIGEVTSVQVLPEHRRRGFGTAMTWAAIGEATRRGCTAITLTSTELGYPVYLGMGFMPICSYRTYLPPE